MWLDETDAFKVILQVKHICYFLLIIFYKKINIMLLIHANPDTSNHVPHKQTA